MARGPMVIDIAVAVLILLALFLGYQRGVIQPLMAEIFFFGTLLVIFRFHDQYTSEMQKLLHLNPVLSVFVALILAHSGLQGYKPVFHTAAIAAFMGYAFGTIPMGIWWGQPWRSVAKGMLDGLIYACLTAGTFGWLLSR